MSHIEVGARVAGTYEIAALIGRGGTGTVWAARHLRLPGKQVAIKFLVIVQGGTAGRLRETAARDWLERVRVVLSPGVFD